jgi:hypothetical protein
MNASFPVLNFCNPQLYDCINLELGDKESPRRYTYVRVLGSSSLTLTNTQHIPSKTNHNAHLCLLLHWCLQVNRIQVVAPNLVILEKRYQSTILLLADAISFQMAALFYTANMQTEKLRLNDMTTNFLAAAMVEMMVVGSKRRVWMGRRSRFSWYDDSTINRRTDNDGLFLSLPLPQWITQGQCWTTKR